MLNDVDGFCMFFAWGLFLRESIAVQWRVLLAFLEHVIG